MMQLKANQTYLKSKEQYHLVCRLAQVRVERKALAVEEDRLVQELRACMFDARELVDLQFLGQQQRAGVTEEELAQMWVARITDDDLRLEVHPAYVSERFRPGGTQPEEPLHEARQMELFQDVPETLPATKENVVKAEKEETEKRTKKEKEEKESSHIATLPTSPSAAAAAAFSDASEGHSEEPLPLRLLAEVSTHNPRTTPAAAAANPNIVPAGKEVIYVDRFIPFWNRLMNGRGIPQIDKLRGKRLELLRARTMEYGSRIVMDVLHKAAASSFLNGGGDQGWKASIDWILKPDNFMKIKEGLYDDRQLTPEQQAKQQAQQRAQQCREANKAIEQQISQELHQSIALREHRAATPAEIAAILGDRACPELLEAARRQIAQETA